MSEDKEKKQTNLEKIDEAERLQPENLTRAQKVVRVFDRFGDLFMLNIMFVVSCIPIFTIGAALTALYTVTNKMVKNEEGPVSQEYWRAFKVNFKEATKIWLIMMLIIAALVGQYLYILFNENQISKYLIIILGFEFIIMCFEMPLLFPLVARYKNTTGAMIKNSLFIALSNIGTWFRMFFIWMVPVVVYLMRPNLFFYTWYLWGLILTSLLAYTCSMTLVKLYEKLEAPKEEASSDDTSDEDESDDENDE